MAAPSCPSREMLFQYSIGTLSNQQSDDLAGHLESCPDCQATIMTLEDAEDTLIGRLRAPLSAESCLAEPQFQTALAEAIAGEKGTGLETGTGPLKNGPVPVSFPFSLGEYQILEELGRGGMGRVFKALHTKLDRVVAVKVLPRARLGDRHALTRFEREMKAVGRLAHPTIVQAHDAREIDGTPVLIMEFVDGLDLAEIAHRTGPLPVADACELVRRTALALQCAHEHGLVHRDIKPSNIMLTRSGEVKLLDLGLARFYAQASAGEEMTGTGQAMGTADYMAPEQASDSRTVDIRADIYSLGCTLYKLISGRAPFSGPEYHGTLDKLNAHVHQPAPPIRQFIANVPEELSAILDRLLAKDPADRFPTPAEVAKILEPFCSGANLVDVITRALSETCKAATGTNGHHAEHGRLVGCASADDSSLSLRERARVRADQIAGKIQTKTNPAPLPDSARRRWIPVFIALALAFMAAGFALGIIIRINKDGRETAVEVPPGSTTHIGPDGQVEVNLPDKAKIEKPSAKTSPAKSIGEKSTEEDTLLMHSAGRDVFAKPSTPSFRTAKITRGDITATLSATGTIEPAETVDVSAQVSGRIVNFGDDPRGETDPQFKGKPIDYNSPVEEGTVLARLDDALYKSRVEQEKAGLSRAEAELALAKVKYERAQTQEKVGLPNADQVPKAVVDAAEAAVEQSKAALEQAQISLNHTVIKSLVNGVIVDRRVNVGQNVAPTPNAPTLFLIAKNMKNMYILASVDEADIGRIRDGMAASFTVDAFPNETFIGKVIQIRKDAQRTQNAVSYTVVLSFDNSNLKLMPYLTANLKFQVETRRDILLVPNAALRWKPRTEMVAPDARESDQTAKDKDNYCRLWVKDPDGQHVRQIDVQTGLTDGTMTEISSPDVKEGMEVVIGVALKGGTGHGPTINPSYRPEGFKQPATQQ